MRRPISVEFVQLAHIKFLSEILTEYLPYACRCIQLPVLWGTSHFACAMNVPGGLWGLKRQRQKY
jgi:integral membrane sensor domain MASE1